MTVGSGRIHDTAKQAARDVRDQYGNTTSDYIIGRIVEAVLAVCGHQPQPKLEVERWVLDVDGWDDE